METRYPCCKKLPLTFDVGRLHADLDIVSENVWIKHFVPDNYEGEWSGLPLRAKVGATHPIQQMYSDPSASEWENTELLKQCGYFQEVLSQIHCDLTTVRLLKLTAGSQIKEHTDYDLSIDNGVARLHVPITTNPDIDFIVAGNSVKMAPGDLWYCDFTKPHSINNKSESDRIHIVIDCISNKWLESAISKN